MAIIKWTPFYEPFLDMERAFSDMGMAATNFNPAIDLYEKGDAFIAEVAIAGIDPDKLAISIEGTVLDIEGSIEKKSEVDEKNYYRKEVRTGSFHRLISLPSAVNGDGATAEYEKGILKITMPKKEETKAKTVSIKVKK